MTTTTYKELEATHAKHVTVTRGMSGYFAVIIWWNPEMGGFWEPWDTGVGRHEHEDDARVEAIALADCEGLPYLMPGPGSAA